LRQYFPKSSDLGLISDDRVREVADELNDPRELARGGLNRSGR
jgi:IS30 family transposase